MSTRQPRKGEAAMTVEEVHPAAPLDPSARVITAFVALVALAWVVVTFITVARSFERDWVLQVSGPSVLVAILLAALVMIPFAFSPTGYALGASDLAVTRRAARPLLFPLASLAAARPTAMPRSWRVLGVGGLFGWWGWFRNREWGRYKVYATDHRRGVLLEWPGFKLFVSPEDPEALCAAMLARSRRGRPHPERA